MSTRTINVNLSIKNSGNVDAIYNVRVTYMITHPDETVTTGAMTLLSNQPIAVGGTATTGPMSQQIPYIINPLDAISAQAHLDLVSPVSKNDVAPLVSAPVFVEPQMAVYGGSVTGTVTITAKMEGGINVDRDGLMVMAGPERVRRVVR